VGHTDRISSLTLLSDGKTLASGSGDKTIRLWNLESGRKLKLVGHTDWVRSLTLLSDGKTLVSGSDDQTICFWDLETTHAIFTMPLSFTATALTAKERDLLYAGDNAGGLWCWQLGELGSPPLLLWATHPTFTCTGASIANCIDLSEDNRRLMIEYGAKDIPK
jgi:eukaryotic-like serine/threonine-protein kinase